MSVEFALRGDLPLDRQCPKLDPARNRSPVHEVEATFTGYGVLPENIRIPVPIVIRRSRNSPLGGKRSEFCPAGDCGSVHQVEAAFSGGGVLPQNIRIPIPIEV